ncbi:MAG TPA: hypothetical protein VJA65_01785, partial [bacterium]|nr:hypothetical protein [bacterium]
VAVLPGFLQTVTQGIPLTWWLEAMRRGLLGSGTLRSFAWASDAQVLVLLAVSTAVWMAIGLAVFTLAERRARALGILDRESAF